MNGLPSLVITTPNATHPLFTDPLTGGLEDEDRELRNLVNDLDSMSEGSFAAPSNGTDDEDDNDFEVWDAPSPSPKRVAWCK